MLHDFFVIYYGIETNLLLLIIIISYLTNVEFFNFRILLSFALFAVCVGPIF